MCSFFWAIEENLIFILLLMILLLSSRRIYRFTRYRSRRIETITDWFVFNIIFTTIFEVSFHHFLSFYVGMEKLKRKISVKIRRQRRNTNAPNYFLKVFCILAVYYSFSVNGVNFCEKKSHTHTLVRTTANDMSRITASACI